MNRSDSLSTSLALHANVMWKGFIEQEYDDLGHSNKHLHKNATTSSTFCNILPWALSFFLQKNLLTTTLAPSWGPLPWLSQKKFHNILQPPIKFGYLDTKYHGLLLFNWAAHPLFHTQCHCGG